MHTTPTYKNEKNEQKIKQLGGIEGLRKILGSNFVKGLDSNAEDLALRREKYGRNEVINTINTRTHTNSNDNNFTYAHSTTS